ncbi:phosphate/phosphite/phosphonate ABC transporter substrate-binding protein [Microbacterium album]|uniref:Phosphonate ABC transporter substrate-binding protein n=1 Tax=Microbacterium album TaxID=2053191 RepID=A0A917IE17_9MICO|nr:phosphate/phosphite/phosphonate ABC transporter substrate-binding protein [Microbacterium album]GGH34440.1 phosphonate ABC transporter substrate-binding protein [Microbacterium album]
MNTRKLTRTLLPAAAVLALALSGCAGGGQSADEDEPLVLQFVPTRTDSDMQAQAQPLASLLSDELGREVQVTIATDYSTIIEAMAAGQVDIGIMPPATYVLAHDQGAAEVLLQAQIPAMDPDTATPTDMLVDSFRGEIVVRADSGIESLEDLRGATIAAQNAASASGYIFPVVELADAGLDIHEDLTITTVAGIDSAILAVLNGDVDAAFAFEGGRVLLLSEIPDITEQVSVLYLTENRIPNDAIAVQPSMDADLKQQVKDAFLAIAADPEGHEIVSSLYSHQGYAEADQAAYDIVREYTERAGDL